MNRGGRGIFAAGGIAVAFGIYLAAGGGAVFLAPLLSSTTPVTRPAGTAVTTTRSGTAYDVNSSGVVYSAATNAGRYHDTKGLASFAATTNSLLHRRIFSAGGWTASNITLSTTTGSDGVAASATRLTATAANGTVLQALVFAAATRTTSFDIKRVAGSGVIDMTRDNGGTWTALDTTSCFDLATDQTGTLINSGTWVRCRRNSSVLNPTVGLRLRTSGDVIDVDFAQDETGLIATPRCDVPGVPGSVATCNADVHTVPTTGWPTTSGEVSVKVTALSSAAPSSQGVLFDSRTTSTTHGLFIFRDTSNRIVFRVYDGSGIACSVTSSAQTWSAEKTIEGRWTPTTCELLGDGVSLGTGVGTGTPTGHRAAAVIGADISSSLQDNMWHRDLCLGRACP